MSLGSSHTDTAFVAESKKKIKLQHTHSTFQSCSHSYLGSLSSTSMDNNHPPPHLSLPPAAPTRTEATLQGKAHALTHALTSVL